MQRSGGLLATLLLAVTVASAQDGDNFFQKLHLQIHGNAAQGFLFSSSNNYLTTKSSDGSAKWTEGSLSVGKAITDRFHVGAQVHSYSLGQLGRQNVTLDWAYGDYKFSSYFGIRGGKVKTPFGLYNDVQDVDAVYPWALLPQALYPADSQGFGLSHTGGVVYGEFSPSKYVGTFVYQAFGGTRTQPRNGGFDITMAAQGISLGDESGPMGGIDLRWRTPLEGFAVGGAYAKIELDAPNARAGLFPLPMTDRYQEEQLYTQFEKGKITLSAEGKLNPVFLSMGPAPASYIPMRSWYAMASYRATKKLTLGSYYDQTWFFIHNRDRQDPANYLKDVAVSTRFDFDRYFYAKLEGHFMEGNSVGFYQVVNPNGLAKNTGLLLARFGFAF